METNHAEASNATAGFMAEDWIVERLDWGRQFEFARADPDQKQFLLPITEIQAWASTKVPARQAKGGQNRSSFYKPILDEDEFRMVELKPGSYDEELRGALHHYSVEFLNMESDMFLHSPYTPDDERYTQRFALSTDDYVTPVQYTALSYSWGVPDPDSDTTIDCAGHKLKITKSLATALRHFRQNHHSILLWVDQICINQLDDQEKEQQIPLMSSIYQYAVNTAIWLGEADSGTASAMKLLEDLGTCLQFNEAISIDPEEFENKQLPSRDSREWQNLMNLLGREWFSRLWIIQEVILSRDPWVLCGDNHVHWRVVDHGCDQLASSGIFNWLHHNFSASDSHGESVKRRGDLCRTVLDLGAAKSQYDGGSKPPLLRLLVSTRNAEARDARDKIYGLQGICASVDKAAVRISYDVDWTVARLYHDMAVKLLNLNSEGLSDIIHCVDHENSDMPSWVPDWRLPRETSPLGSSTSMLGVYQASGELSKTRYPGYNFTILDQNIAELRIRGIPFGRLCFIGDQFSDPDISYENPAPISNRTLLQAHTFVESKMDLVSGSVKEQAFSTFWHTLVAGQDGDGLRACSESFGEVFSLLLDETTGKSPSLTGQTYSERQKLPKGRGRLELKSLESRKLGQTFQEIRKALRRVMRNRRLGFLENGLLGLIPRHSKRGDVVYIVYGCIVPFLLRPVENQKGKFRLVGECYVHSIMRGEAASPMQENMEEIILV